MKVIRLQVHRWDGEKSPSGGPNYLTVTLTPKLRDRIRFLAHLVKSSDLRGVYENNRDPYWGQQLEEEEGSKSMACLVHSGQMYVESDLFYWTCYHSRTGEMFESQGYPIPGEND